MEVKKNHSLKSYNTFGLEVNADYFAEFNSALELSELLEFCKKSNQRFFILGGGSNIVFLRDFKGIVIQNNIKGISIVKETHSNAIIKSGAGEIWHELIMFLIDKDLGGAENLSLIPGRVGAGPMQNIGAYGVELQDIFYELEAYEIETGRIRIFNKSECKFGYRESIFKNRLREKYIILNVSLELTKPGYHKLNTSYGAILDELKQLKRMEPSVKNISDAVCKIRRSKLPDPAEIGNAGSFFKNPVIDEEKFLSLKSEYPEIVSYKTAEGYKLAAGWLIEKCGWKGRRINDAGVHKNQALVLVNYGGATGKEIFDISESILQEVHTLFGIHLEREVNLI